MSTVTGTRLGNLGTDILYDNALSLSLMSNVELVTLLFAVVIPTLVALWSLKLSHWVSSYAGGLMAGLVLFVVLPEVWSEAGTVGKMLPFAAGMALAWGMDRFVHPACPECGDCSSWVAMLPLWLALGIHALIDGALLELARPGSVAAWTLLVHRMPEGVATAAVLRRFQPASRSVGWQVVGLQMATVLGFGGAALVDPALLRGSYVFAGGVLVFLGLHQLHHNWRSAAGVASVWVMRLVAGMIL